MLRRLRREGIEARVRGNDVWPEGRSRGQLGPTRGRGSFLGSTQVDRSSSLPTVLPRKTRPIRGDRTPRPCDPVGQPWQFSRVPPALGSGVGEGQPPGSAARVREMQIPTAKDATRQFAVLSTESIRNVEIS